MTTPEAAARPTVDIAPQSEKYAEGLPDTLPFHDESTGVETLFTNGLDPESRSQRVFQGRLVPQDPQDEPARALRDKERTERSGTASPVQPRLFQEDRIDQ